MDFRRLIPDYAVSPQITPADLPAIKAAGFTVVINNRPDAEIPPDLCDAAMRKAAESLGLVFVTNMITSAATVTPENVAAQRAALDEAKGPVFAYCATGNRCSIVWALAEAKSRPVDELIGLPARFGYQLDHLRPRIAALQNP